MGADLTEAGLTGADLTGAQLDGADLRGAIITTQQLQVADCGEHTRIDHELALELHWLELDRIENKNTHTEL